MTDHLEQALTYLASNPQESVPITTKDLTALMLQYNGKYVIGGFVRTLKATHMGGSAYLLTVEPR